MSLTAEQKMLIDAINARVTEVRDAARRAFPSNKAFHEEFRVGAAPATTPAEAIDAGQQLAPVMKEYRAILFGKGIDMAKTNHLAQLVASLEKVRPAAVEVPVPAPAPAAAAKPAAEPAKSKKKKGGAS